MKFLNTFLCLLMVALFSVDVSSTRSAYCSSHDNDTGYKNCPNCDGWSDGGNSIKPLEKLHDCGGKDLNLIEYEHQCKCDGGELKCREWNSCRASTVTNYCKCYYNGDDNTCKPGTENKLTSEGGVCFCPDKNTEGSSPIY